MISTPRPRCHWTPEEDRVLLDGWCEFALTTLAQRVKRSINAVLCRAKVLGLSRKRHGLTRPKTVARRLGYDLVTVERAIAALGLHLDTLPTSGSKPGVKRKAKGLNEEQIEAVSRYLLERPAYVPHAMPGATRTAANAWGTGGKPPACLGCGSTTRPHKGYGRCQPCAVAYWRAAHPERVKAYRQRARRTKRDRVLDLASPESA